MKVVLILFFLSLLLATCVVQKDPCMHGSGITGRVFWLEGNHMPAPERERLSEKLPAKRQVVVYALTSTDDVDPVRAPLFAQVRTREIVKVWTDAEGQFKICLSPGVYSVFTIEEEGYFANRFDDKGHIQPVLVKEGQFTDMIIDIDYKAYY